MQECYDTAISEGVEAYRLNHLRDFFLRRYAADPSTSNYAKLEKTFISCVQEMTVNVLAMRAETARKAAAATAVLKKAVASVAIAIRAAARPVVLKRLFQRRVGRAVYALPLLPSVGSFVPSWVTLSGPGFTEPCYAVRCAHCSCGVAHPSPMRDLMSLISSSFGFVPSKSILPSLRTLCPQGSKMGVMSHLSFSSPSSYFRNWISAPSSASPQPEGLLVQQPVKVASEWVPSEPIQGPLSERVSLFARAKTLAKGASRRSFTVLRACLRAAGKVATAVATVTPLGVAADGTPSVPSAVERYNTVKQQVYEAILKPHIPCAPPLPPPFKVRSGPLSLPPPRWSHRHRGDFKGASFAPFCYDPSLLRAHCLRRYKPLGRPVFQYRPFSLSPPIVGRFTQKKCEPFCFEILGPNIPVPPPLPPPFKVRSGPLSLPSPRWSLRHRGDFVGSHFSSFSFNEDLLSKSSYFLGNPLFFDSGDSLSFFSSLEVVIEESMIPRDDLQHEPRFLLSAHVRPKHPCLGPKSPSEGHRASRRYVLNSLGPRKLCEASYVLRDRTKEFGSFSFGLSRQLLSMNRDLEYSLHYGEYESVCGLQAFYTAATCLRKCVWGKAVKSLPYRHISPPRSIPLCKRDFYNAMQRELSLGTSDKIENQMEPSPPVIAGGGGLGIRICSTPFLRADTRIKSGSVVQALKNLIPIGPQMCHAGAYGGSYDRTQEDLDEQSKLDESTGAVLPLSALVESLRDKPKGKFRNAYEGHVGESSVRLTEADVFEPVNYWKKKFGNPGTVTTYNMGVDNYCVDFPDSSGVWRYTPLPRMEPEVLRKLAERKGLSSSNSIALDIGIESMVPQGIPIVAFSCIIDDDMQNVEQATISGNFFNLAEDKARSLQLPLVRTSLNRLLSEVGGCQDRLYMATTFPFCGGKDGRPAFQYGTKEFQEHSKSAYETASRMRSSWEDLLAANRKADKRLVAGLNTIAGVCQGFDQQVGDIPPLEVKLKPASRGETLTINNGVVSAPSFNRCSSLRIPEIRMGSKKYGKLPIFDRADTSGSTYEDTPPRHSTAHGGQVADTSLIYVKVGTVAKDAKEGTVVGTVNLRQEVAAAGHRFSLDWLARGLIAPSFRFTLTMPVNPFVGVTLGVCFDFFNRLDPKVLGEKKLPVHLAGMLHNFVFPLSAGPVHEFSVNFAREAGAGLFPTADAFLNPRVVLYVVTDNAMPCSEDWRYCFRIFSEAPEQSGLALKSPYLTLPGEFGNKLTLDTWRGPYSFDLGSASSSFSHSFNLNFARTEHYLEGKTTRSLVGAICSLLQGYGGTLRGRVVRVGTALVACSLMVGLLYKKELARVSELSLMPNMLLPAGEGDFALKVQSPFGRLSLLDDDVKFVIIPDAGPIAAKDVIAPYSFMVYFDCLEQDEGLPPRVIGEVLNFNWATLHQFTVNEFRFQIPARLSDLVLKGCTVSMRNNPLATIIGSCGFFRGRMQVVFEWMLNTTLTTPSSGVQVSTWRGHLPFDDKKGEMLQSHVVSLSQGSTLGWKLEVANFSGFVASAATPTYQECLVDFWTDQAKYLKFLNVNVILDPGFEIYGRSILPLKA
uniref:Polyprotein n=1 Tax=Homalium kanaliense nepovirus TaxID=3115781 RepID=A0AAT9JAN1_9SECO